MKEGHAYFLGVLQFWNVLKEHMILFVCIASTPDNTPTSSVYQEIPWEYLLCVPKEWLSWIARALRAENEMEITSSINKLWGPLMPNFISLSMSAIWQVAISQSKGYGMGNT